MWDIASLTTDTFILTVLAGLACFLLVAVCGAGSPMARSGFLVLASLTAVFLQYYFIYRASITTGLAFAGATPWMYVRNDCINSDKGGKWTPAAYKDARAKGMRDEASPPNAAGIVGCGNGEGPRCTEEQPCEPCNLIANYIEDPKEEFYDALTVIGKPKTTGKESWRDVFTKIQPFNCQPCRTSVDDTYGSDGNCHFTPGKGPYCYKVTGCKLLNGEGPVCEAVDRTAVEPCRTCCRPPNRVWYNYRWLGKYRNLFTIKMTKLDGAALSVAEYTAMADSLMGGDAKLAAVAGARITDGFLQAIGTFWKGLWGYTGTTKGISAVAKDGNAFGPAIFKLLTTRPTPVGYAPGSKICGWTVNATTGASVQPYVHFETTLAYNHPLSSNPYEPVSWPPSVDWDRMVLPKVWRGNYALVRPTANYTDPSTTTLRFLIEDSLQKDVCAKKGVKCTVACIGPPIHQSDYEAALGTAMLDTIRES